ncbi:WYL domain-containing protein [Arcobacter arenosus]|uniref:WYL domain-containing protein n=1 Tax=Arcobacter arenosus TaxID=2576037 RepID=UPI003BA8438D
MNERIKDIYLKLYENNMQCTKENLAEEYDVTIKTIENSIKPYSEEIIYDKKLKKYRFANLLPKYIPYKIFYNIFKESINDTFLKEDFFIIDNLINNDNDLFMIETEKLSEMSKKIIIFTLAINNNCVLEVEYTTNGEEGYSRFIKPHTIFKDTFAYYCFISYEKRNNEKVGELRSFRFDKIGEIKLVEYIENEIFKKDIHGNKYGEYKKDKYVILIFNKNSASFFQDSGLFNKAEYEVIIGLNSENVTVKMYYRNLNLEVISMLQRWMPQIRIHPDDPLKKEIENKIEENYHLFLNS